MTVDSEDLDPIGYFRAGKLRIAAAACIGLLCGAAYGLFSPKWYQATLSAVPSTPPKGPASSLLSGPSLPLGAALDITTDLMGSADVERISAVFQSTSVTDQVIAKFKLLDRYHLVHVEDARKVLWQHCSTRVDKKPQVLSLSCEDRSPETVQAMTAYFGEVANRVMRSISKTSASDERRFLESRVNETREAMDEASRQLRDFQETHRIVSLPEQARAVVTSMATLRAELMEKQMRRSFARGFAANDEAEVSQLDRQIAVLDAKLAAMEEKHARGAGDAPATSSTLDGSGGGGKGAKASVFPPAMEVPKLQYDLERLYREQRIQETLFTLVTQRYEMARINEARDTPTFQVLDHPTLPTKKARPRRMLAMLVGLLVGLVTGLGISLAPHWLKSHARSIRLRGQE